MMLVDAIQQRHEAIRAQRDRLRQALERLVGADTREELEAMEVTIRLLPASEIDKAATIGAIHALLEPLE